MATENGPCCMYKLKPIYNSSSEQMELPTHMYTLPNIYETVVNGKDENKDFLIFEKHQIELLDKLNSLNVKLMEMKNEIDAEYGANSIETTSKLCDSISQVNKCQDIVINANPSHPPFSVWVLCHLLQKQTNVMLNMHVHSTITTLPYYFNLIRGEESSHLRTSHELVITIIWKEIGKDPELMVSPILQTAITCEVNIARYLARLLKPSYDEGDPEISTEIDTWLDTAHSAVLHGSIKERQSTLWNMNSHLAVHEFLTGNSMTVADIVMWSALCQTMLTGNLPANVEKWWKNLHSTGAFLLPKEFLQKN